MSNHLWQLPTGTSAVLDGFAESLDDRFRTRLVELGFQPGERVTCVLQPPFGAPRVYRVSSSVFSLEDRVARQVRIRDDAP